mmetsp:Transcript_43115/g.97443  ORF Transcript_43115/g.97443 Transcript_43115/m.97443 type:complete len:214 (+) Transcript_43115:146-787(+)|eukprot:CAMPEP_0172618536 /NCGR_PEP_ID=MMETSP1068-20121228/82346_1 /TAXON_ID=35684 /ORGANISM="Pseudopedinella elastica, Strain CCMP716" /LENGTH=213 /DNA_ID=CAMNT_0013424825 /DNA_START=94 /DNA_END=735 /DNA_ORIENTATION=+
MKIISATCHLFLITVVTATTVPQTTTPISPVPKHRRRRTNSTKAQVFSRVKKPRPISELAQGFATGVLTGTIVGEIVKDPTKTENGFVRQTAVTGAGFVLIKSPWFETTKGKGVYRSIGVLAGSLLGFCATLGLLAIGIPSKTMGLDVWGLVGAPFKWSMQRVREPKSQEESGAVESKPSERGSFWGRGDSRRPEEPAYIDDVRDRGYPLRKP